MEFAFLTLSVVAVTEFVKRVRVKDFEGAGVVVLAGVIGAAAGFFHIAGLDLVSGFTAGLSAVGVHTVATVAGGK